MAFTLFLARIFDSIKACVNSFFFGGSIFMNIFLIIIIIESFILIFLVSISTDYWRIIITIFFVIKCFLAFYIHICLHILSLLSIIRVYLCKLRRLSNLCILNSNWNEVLLNLFIRNKL